jgi:hypothetical protein
MMLAANQIQEFGDRGSELTEIPDRERLCSGKPQRIF